MILLLGGSGYVGSAFAKGLTKRSLPFQVVSRQQCDYTQRDRLIELIDRTGASFLINAAGYTGKPNVEACELRKLECMEANALLPAVIREVCRMRGIPWGHVSSGCIYNGTRLDGNGFRETDKPNFCFSSPPCSFYSGCKALGEDSLLEVDNVFVWRLRVPFSNQDGPRNYLSKMMNYDRLLDVTNSLADLNEFVDACLHCWQKKVPYGIYNVVNSGSISTREVVDLIKTHLKITRQFNFFDDEAEFMRTTSGVPRSSCTLDNSKLQSTGFKTSEIGDSITRALLNWKESSPSS